MCKLNAFSVFSCSFPTLQQEHQQQVLNIHCSSCSTIKTKVDLIFLLLKKKKSFLLPTFQMPKKITFELNFVQVSGRI